MSLKTACQIALCMAIAAYLISIPGYLLNAVPDMEASPENVLKLILSFLPTLLIITVGTSGFVTFMLSVIKRTQNSNHGTIGMICAAALIGLATLINAGLSLSHIRQVFEYISMLQFSFYAGACATSFICGIIFCTFIIMLACRSPHTTILAVIYIIVLLIDTCAMLNNFLLSLPGASAHSIYLLSSIVIYGAIIIHTIAEILFMIVFIKYTSRNRKTQTPPSETTG